MATQCVHLRAKVWLAPFDFGIMQWVDIRFCQAQEGPEFLEIWVTDEPEGRRGDPLAAGQQVVYQRPAQAAPGLALTGR